MSDGWDESLAVLMRAKLFPSVFLRPVASRVVNIGREGVNVRGVCSTPDLVGFLSAFCCKPDSILPFLLYERMFFISSSVGVC